MASAGIAAAIVLPVADRYACSSPAATGQRRGVRARGGHVRARPPCRKTYSPAGGYSNGSWRIRSGIRSALRHGTRDMLKLAAYVLAARTAIVVPGRIAEIRRDCTGLPSISSRMSSRQNERSLRMAHQHEAAALGCRGPDSSSRHRVRRHIACPRSIAIPAGRPGQQAAQTRQSDLPIQRREQAGTSTRKRANCCRITFSSAASGVHVAIGSRIGGNRRIDVEAIDGRVRIRLPVFAGEFAVGRDDGGASGPPRNVVLAGAAEPSLGIGIVVRRSRLRRRRGRKTIASAGGSASQRSWVGLGLIRRHSVRRRRARTRGTQKQFAAVGERDVAAVSAQQRCGRETDTRPR